MSHMLIPKRSDKRPRRVPSSLYADVVPPGVNVLVVDVNRACLAVTEAKLLHFGYSVITAGGVEEATSILEDKSNDVHLILAEAYFPGMEPFMVLEKLGQKFAMAVVVLSDDEDDYVVLEAISRGAYFYLVKPISAYDVKNLWQFALAKKREEYMAGRVGNSKSDVTAAAKLLEEDRNWKGEDNHGDRAAKASDGKPQGRKRGIEEEDESGEGDREGSVVEKQKKAKVTWTSVLHERFLQAMKALGPDKAHPKRILQHMNMPGLRKEHISSHLQKYRLFLRKEEEEALKNESFASAVITPASSSAGEISPLLFRSSSVAEMTKVGTVSLSLDTPSSSRGSNELETNNSSKTMNTTEINGEPPPPNCRVPESFSYGLRTEHGWRTGLLGSFDPTISTRKVGDAQSGSRANLTVSGSEVSSAVPPLQSAPRVQVQDTVEYDGIEHGVMELEELVKLLDDSEEPDIN